MLLIAVAVLAVTALLTRFLTDWLWFAELGYVSVFLKQLLTMLEYGVPSFIVITLVCYLYLLGIKKAYYKKIGGYSRTEPEKRVNLAALGLSGLFGLVTGFRVASRLWFEILEFVNSTNFNIIDPIFSKDVSFYIFQLSFWQQINGTLVYVLLGFVLVNVIYYVILLNLRKPQFYEQISDEEYQAYQQAYAEYEIKRAKWKQQQGPGADKGLFGDILGGLTGGMGNMGGGMAGAPTPPPKPGGGATLFSKESLSKLRSIAGLQFKILGVLLFLMVGLHFFLQQFTLLYSNGSSIVYGAGFTDINVTLWGYRLLMVLSLAGAVLFVIGLNRRKWRTVLAAPAVMAAVLLLSGVGSWAVQSLIVEPDEISKEQPYLQSNIDFTRYAYDLADIDTDDYEVGYNLDVNDILANPETITNIRINDYGPALKYYNQTQSIRLYYNFNDVDVDRYTVNGEYTQTYLSARELDESSISDSWLNLHIKYTHGYGITLSRVDKVTASGQPDMLIDSIPPVSEVAEIQVSNPAIYFGEDTNVYSIVNTGEQEFDYPNDAGNAYTEYEGEAGIPLNLFTRCLFALREGDIQILVSSNITKDSRIIINRNILERVRAVAPFLAYDDDPYIVVTDQGLYWIFDAYTTSNYYPYSEPYNEYGTNYIRNSVKVVVDAYNGAVDYYIVDNEDPIAMTLQSIYPALFKNFGDMPESLQAHIRYPENMFTIQAQVYAKYHMTDVTTFYQSEDRWDIANEIYGTEETVMTSQYYIMKLPDSDKAEFILSVPYTPSGKDNLTAILVARNDGEAYGDLTLYQMPKDRVIYGPAQVEALINQNTEISQDFTLWSSAGSTYTRGNMFLILIEDSLMYVEPIYLESANSSIPEVKRVIIYYNGRIAYENTLAEALDSMFGKGASAVLDGTGAEPDYEIGQETYQPGQDSRPEETEGMSFEEIAALAQEAYDQAQAAAQAGDWAAYGEYLYQLGQYLGQLLGDDGSTAMAVDEEALPALLDTNEEAPAQGE